jgi:hypothetical protein
MHHDWKSGWFLSISQSLRNCGKWQYLCTNENSRKIIGVISGQKYSWAKEISGDCFFFSSGVQHMTVTQVCPPSALSNKPAIQCTL